MKKLIFLTLCVILAVCQAYAQEPEINLTVPVMGTGKFFQKHYIYQTVEISTIVGKDKDEAQDSFDDSDEVSGSSSRNNNLPDIVKNLNLGMNIGYSLIFVPGKIKDDLLEINRFGFAYSAGFIAAFDRQDEYDVTCDFLGKIGVETGNGHALGIGVDLLLGGGKSAGVTYVEVDDEWQSYPYTKWCFKQGMQVWLNTNLLTTGIKNTDILAFGRFVYSKDPQGDEITDTEDITLDNWIEESWQFGITLRYRF